MWEHHFLDSPFFYLFIYFFRLRVRKHQTEPDEQQQKIRSVNDSKCRFMSDACLANSSNNNDEGDSSGSEKIDFIMCAHTFGDSDGELSFWTPAAFQLFAKNAVK